MVPIKTGIASFGMSGQVFHAPFLCADPHFKLCTIVERTKELSKEKYPQVAIARSVEEMLEDADIELVIINTPDSTHFDYARKALEAGKHVVVEKPFTTTSAQGDELIRLAGEKERMLSVYQNRRWDADFLTVKEIAAKGLLGDLVEYESVFSRFRNFIKPGTWKETGQCGGGLTYNLGSHLIDQAVQLFGMPEAVYADIDRLRSGTEVDDYFLIRLYRPRRNPKLKITLKAGYLMREPEPRFVLHGTNGSYVKHGVDGQEAALLSGETPGAPGWGLEGEAEWGIISYEKDGKEYREKYPGVRGDYGAFYRNIYGYLRGREQLSTSAVDNIHVVRLIEAAFRSSREEKVVNL